MPARPAIIDADQHIHEPRDAWRAHIDPAFRDDALSIEDDDLGYAWLTWPHAEAIADHLGIYQKVVVDVEGRARDKVFAGNAAWLLGT